MQKLFIILAIFISLTGCVRKMSIEQGNVLTPEMANQLHRGMSPAEVKQIMGTPVLMNTFNDNRFDYIYTFKPGRGATTEKRIVLQFQNNSLKDIQVYMPAAATDNAVSNTDRVTPAAKSENHSMLQFQNNSLKDVKVYMPTASNSIASNNEDSSLDGSEENTSDG